jgi:hypothetical protein
MNDLVDRLRLLHIEASGGGDHFCQRDDTDWPCDTALLIAALDAQPVGLARLVGLDELAAALHATALRNHNVGEGHHRSICRSWESHRPRAEAIRAALARPESKP